MTESEILLHKLIDVSMTANIRGKFKEEAVSIPHMGNVWKRELCFCEDNHYKAFLELFEKLYHQSTKDNFFWQYCPFDVYSKEFEKKKIQNKTMFPDISERDFVINELFEIQEYYQEESQFFKEYSLVSTKLSFKLCNYLIYNNIQKQNQHLHLISYIVRGQSSKQYEHRILCIYTIDQASAKGSF